MPSPARGGRVGLGRLLEHGDAAEPLAVGHEGALLPSHDEADVVRGSPTSVLGALRREGQRSGRRPRRDVRRPARPGPCDAREVDLDDLRAGGSGAPSADASTVPKLMSVAVSSRTGLAAPAA